ncbi:hypothetical protein VF21_09275 [Pseudogymnoascus sp. 05NY08]|nr:hypothetical protein VF21_09275 [Pseudogymnoascus sp. 05NY08]
MSSASSPLSVPISLRAIVLLLCLLSQVPFAQSTICYDVTGLQSEAFFPCEPDAEVSSCCYPDDICFSNGLCSPSPANKAKHPKDFYVTPFFWNACSDPTFQDPKCFSGCFNVSGNGVKSCPEAGPNAYCCYGYSGCDCTDPSQVVTARAGSIVTTIDPDATTHTLSSTTRTHAPSSTSTSEDSTQQPRSQKPARLQIHRKTKKLALLQMLRKTKKPARLQILRRIKEAKAPQSQLALELESVGQF